MDSIVHGVAESDTLSDFHFEPASFTLPELAGEFFTASTSWEAHHQGHYTQTGHTLLPKHSAK